MKIDDTLTLGTKKDRTEDVVYEGRGSWET